MFCKQCQNENKKSKIYPGTSFMTNAGVTVYYDEDGRYHVHNGNSTSTNYSCSNGHIWIENKRDKCWCEEEVSQ